MGTDSSKNTDQWVNKRMDQLNEQTEWEPNVNRALAKFREQRVVRRSWMPGWMLVASAALTACVCVIAVVEFRGVSAADRILKDRQPAPDFALKDASGATIRLSDYKNKVVLLNFWATWCGGCKMEIPCFMEFENKYKDRGFTVIGVSMDDEGFKAVKPFFEEKKMNYPVVVGDARLAKLYGVESMPETVLIDGSGRIAAFHLGTVDKDSLEREIRTLLD